jgi:hypothetical protein
MPLSDIQLAAVAEARGLLADVGLTTLPSANDLGWTYTWTYVECGILLNGRGNTPAPCFQKSITCEFFYYHSTAQNSPLRQFITGKGLNKVLLGTFIDFIWFYG